ncbi:hypothetical protein TrRE_jg273, partial [Triparma retinervis]
MSPLCGYVPQLDSWSCGYASFNMVLLSHHKRPLTIAALQTLLERAWDLGYDPPGRVHYKGRILGKRGAKAWTGPAEWATVMSASRVPGVVRAYFEGGEER